MHKQQDIVTFVQLDCPQHQQQPPLQVGATWSQCPPGLPEGRAVPPAAETPHHPPETVGLTAMHNLLRLLIEH